MTSELAPTPENDRLLKINDLCARWGASRPTIWRMRQRGELPLSVRVSPGIFGWMLSDVLAIERGSRAVAAHEREAGGTER